MNVELRFRLVDEFGVIVEQRVAADHDVEAAAEAAAVWARSWADEGHVVRLEVMDPDGDLFPAGVWQLIAEVR